MNTNESRQDRRLASSRACRRQPLLYFGGQAFNRRPSPSGSLGWVEGVSKHRARSSDGDEVVELLSENACFRLVTSVLVRLGRASWLKNSDRGRHDVFLGATAGVRCSMVYRRGRGYRPGRLSLRFVFYHFDRGRRLGRKSRQAASGVLSHRRDRAT